MLLSLSLASKAIVVEPGKSIAAVRIGMTRAEVSKLHKLAPDGVERAERTGYTSGALYFLFDAKDVVVLVGVELQKSGGLRVGKVSIPPKISAVDFAKRLPGCTVSDGSGGHAIHCEAGLDAYDSYGDAFVSAVHLGPG